MSFHNRLKERREALGLKQSELGAMLGVQGNAISNYETGFSSPKADILYKMFDVLKCDANYLFQDEMKTLSENKESQALSSEAMNIAHVYDSLDKHGREVVKVVADAEAERIAEAAPVVDLGTIRHYMSRPAAGPGGLVEGEDYEDIPRTPDMPKTADYCLTVSGDSMEPYIKDGQMIYVERDAELDVFDVGVFSVNGAIYVKQYCPTMPGVLMLLSANPKREAANITVLESGNDTLTYYGRVIMKKKLPEPRYK